LQAFGVLPAGFLPYNNMLYGLAGACLFSFYLAYHTKLYVFGAMTLYNDIINMFVYLLRVIGEDKQR
jgi:FtsH-binding integral membrane protein